jgi:hypothetical protein
LGGLTIYGVFALFYLGVPMLARRLDRPLEPVGGAAALLLVSLALLFFLALGPAAQVALWGLAILLIVLNAGLFLEGTAGRLPILSIAGTVLSWLVLAAWWSTADVTAGLVPALIVVAGFAVFSLAGATLLGSRVTSDDPTGIDRRRWWSLSAAGGPRLFVPGGGKARAGCAAVAAARSSPRARRGGRCGRPRDSSG